MIGTTSTKILISNEPLCMHKTTGKKKMPSDTGLWIIKPEGTREKQKDRTIQAQSARNKNQPLYNHYCDGTRNGKKKKPTFVQSLL